MNRAFFSTEYRPVPRRGFTPIEAVEFMRREFPAVKHWTCWRPNYALARWLGMLVGKGATTHGRIADWRWSRVRSSYPSVLLWAGYDAELTRSDGWVGVLEIKGPNGEKFLLFAFLDAEGAVGSDLFGVDTRCAGPQPFWQRRATGVSTAPAIDRAGLWWCGFPVRP